ncbi:unnamed protein product [Cylindrotheca closterium]|uniref:DUF6824 domain-containing protein n=1 Tax=Cylindrotheca closterium TaxID=2856 RepID=A0AAD2CXQ7_9STRA|nr:unnamed protein product [Cylindrotheca closterium]
MSTLDKQFRDSSCLCSNTTARNPTNSFLFPQKGDQKGKEEVDTLLSEALNGLTFEERQMHQEVVHGVEDKIAEEEIFIKTRLKELDETLLLIKAGSNYQAAKTMNREYVTARSLRLMFLRANRYDSKAAAHQMLSFFDAKQRLFGMDKLAKDITVEDLDDDDLECLRSGFLQLAGRDSADRQVMFELPGLRVAKTLLNELRARYYIMMSVVESERNQLRGHIGVCWTIGEYREKQIGHPENIELVAAIPIHCSAVHFCTDEIGKYVICKMLVKAMSNQFRVRFTPHFGSHLECSYRLCTYGIATAMLPFTSGTNQVILDYHNNWVLSRLAKQDKSKPALFRSLPPPLRVPITETRDADVLFNSGEKSCNAGNERLRALVKSLIPQYTSGTNDKKKVIVDGLIDDVIGNEGGRFLKKQNGPSDGWEELRPEQSRAKVTQMFRNLKRQSSTRKSITDGIPISDEPHPDDVVFGNLQRSRGSEFLQQLITDRSKVYDTLDRGMKIKVVEEIARRIKDKGVRFLQAIPESGGWVEVSNDDACKRISKYFRNKRRSIKRG